MHGMLQCNNVLFVLLVLGCDWLTPEHLMEKMAVCMLTCRPIALRSLPVCVKAPCLEALNTCALHAHLYAGPLSSDPELREIQIRHRREMAMLRMEIDRARTATELEGIKSLLNDMRLQTEGACPRRPSNTPSQLRAKCNYTYKLVLAYGLNEPQYKTRASGRRHDHASRIALPLKPCLCQSACIKCNAHSTVVLSLALLTAGQTVPNVTVQLHLECWPHHL